MKDPRAPGGCRDLPKPSCCCRRGARETQGFRAEAFESRGSSSRDHTLGSAQRRSVLSLRAQLFQPQREDISSLSGGEQLRDTRLGRTVVQPDDVLVLGMESAVPQPGPWPRRVWHISNAPNLWHELLLLCKEQSGLEGTSQLTLCHPPAKGRDASHQLRLPRDWGFRSTVLPARPQKAPVQRTPSKNS